MASYIVPIADLEESDVYIQKFEANSLLACEQKVMDHIESDYDWDDDVVFDDSSYYNFLKDLANNKNILIGEIYELDLL